MKLTSIYSKKLRDSGLRPTKQRIKICEVLQSVKNVRYEIDMKKIMSPGGTTVGLANGIVLADNKKIYSAESLKVGLFK